MDSRGQEFSWAWTAAGAVLAMVIVLAAGIGAALWFFGGFLACFVFACWEIGRDDAIAQPPQISSTIPHREGE